MKSKTETEKCSKVLFTRIKTKIETIVCILKTETKTKKSQKFKPTRKPKPIFDTFPITWIEWTKFIEFFVKIWKLKTFLHGMFYWVVDVIWNGRLKILVIMIPKYQNGLEIDERFFYTRICTTLLRYCLK